MPGKGGSGFHISLIFASRPPSPSWDSSNSNQLSFSWFSISIGPRSNHCMHCLQCNDWLTYSLTNGLETWMIWLWPMAFDDLTGTILVASSDSRWRQTTVNADDSWQNLLKLSRDETAFVIYQTKFSKFELWIVDWVGKFDPWVRCTFGNVFCYTWHLQWHRHLPRHPQNLVKVSRTWMSSVIEP